VPVLNSSPAVMWQQVFKKVLMKYNNELKKLLVNRSTCYQALVVLKLFKTKVNKMFFVGYDIIHQTDEWIKRIYLSTHYTIGVT